MPKLHRSSALDEAGVPTYGDGEPALFQCQAAAGGGGSSTEIRDAADSSIDSQPHRGLGGNQVQRGSHTAPRLIKGNQRSTSSGPQGPKRGEAP